MLIVEANLASARPLPWTGIAGNQGGGEAGKYRKFVIIALIHLVHGAGVAWFEY